MKKVKNKLILITGASSGIGEATAKLLAQQGAHILLVARGKENLQRVKKDIEEKDGKADYFTLDLSDANAVETVSNTIREKIGVPDVIINNAGAGNWLSIFETSNNDFTKMQSAPHLAAFYITKSFIHYMAKT